MPTHAHTYTCTPHKCWGVLPCSPPASLTALLTSCQERRERVGESLTLWVGEWDSFFYGLGGQGIKIRRKMKKEGGRDWNGNQQTAVLHKWYSHIYTMTSGITFPFNPTMFTSREDGVVYLYLPIVMSHSQEPSPMSSYTHHFTQESSAMLQPRSWT